ncbi:MAG: DUF4943 family protein [Bacteroidales bacterium]|nr:DUF4943 family protein [Bacteroidales bacterium]
MKRIFLTILLFLPLVTACTKSEVATPKKVRIFVENLRSGGRNFLVSFSEECGFTPESIPYFLEYATDETLLIAQPSPFSSYMGYVPLGVVVLWYVESIRTGGNPKLGGLVSLFPHISKNGERLDGESAVLVVPELSGYYKAWWKKYGSNPRVAVQIDPLKDTGYSW